MSFSAMKRAMSSMAGNAPPEVPQATPVRPFVRSGLPRNPASLRASSVAAAARMPTLPMVLVFFLGYAGRLSLTTAPRVVLKFLNEPRISDCTETLF